MSHWDTKHNVCMCEHQFLQSPFLMLQTQAAKYDLCWPLAASLED